MRVTVAICTWNRADLLDQTLGTLRDVRVPEGLEWEVLVVNNNCTDHTDEVVARHAGPLPLRRVFEPAQGHSNARNRAVAEATGDLLLWTDDDVLVGREWLAEMAKAAGDFPGASYFGGAIEPWFGEEPPGWLRANLGLLGGVLVILDHGPEVRRLREGEMVFGASLAFRTEVLRGRLFDPDLGRKGTSLIGYDEVGLTRQLHAEGKYGVWVGTSRLRHYIPSSRMTERFVWDWFVADGRSAVRAGYASFGGRRVGGVPVHLVLGYARQRLRCLRRSAAADRGWLEALRDAAQTRGFVAELRQEHLKRLRGPGRRAVDDAGARA